MTKPDRQPIVVRRGEGRCFVEGLTCRISSASTGGAYCAFEVVTPPGDGVPLHVHSGEDEVYYILEGEYEIRCGGSVFTVDAGAMAVLPRNVPHAFRNVGKTPSRTLTIFIPGGFDVFVQELNNLAGIDASDQVKRDAIRRKYGIRMVDESTA